MCVCIIVDKHEGVQKDASSEYKHIKRGKYTSKAKKKVLVR